MTKILLSGCQGAMGKTIYNISSERSDFEIVAGIDRKIVNNGPFPVYARFEDVVEEFDIIVDFSSTVVLPSLLSYAKKAHKPIVIATTGFNEEQIANIHHVANLVPIFFSANMALGVSLLKELAAKAASVLGMQYNIEIIEKHHNQKVDAPSGTALMLANAISQATSFDAKYVYDRHSTRQKREPEEIGIHSIRGGTIVGEHEVMFAGKDEIISLTHIAYSKTIFANGAIRAAIFMKDKPAGLYDMSDLVTSNSDN